MILPEVVHAIHSNSSDEDCNLRVCSFNHDNSHRKFPLLGGNAGNALARHYTPPHRNPQRPQPHRRVPPAAPISFTSQSSASPRSTSTTRWPHFERLPPPLVESQEISATTSTAASRTIRSSTSSNTGLRPVLAAHERTETFSHYGQGVLVKSATLHDTVTARYVRSFQTAVNRHGDSLHPPFLLPVDRPAHKAPATAPAAPDSPMPGTHALSHSSPDFHPSASTAPAWMHSFGERSLHRAIHGWKRTIART